MYRYLAILGDRSGQWTSGPLTEVYVFEAEDDDSAISLIKSHLLDNPRFGLELLGRITAGIKVEKIDVANSSVASARKLSREKKQEMGFESVFIGQLMLSQLQSYDPAVRENRLKEIRKMKEEDRADKQKVAAMPLPKVGDNIYVPSAAYLSHGVDDVTGGLAKITSVAPKHYGRELVHFVTVREIPGEFCWETFLALQQDELKKRFSKKRAYPSPDNRPDFNDF